MQSTTNNNNDGRDNEANLGDLLDTVEGFNIFGGHQMDNHVGGHGANDSVMSGGISPLLSPARGDVAAADSSPTALERSREQTFPARSAPPPPPLLAGVSLPPGYSTQLVASLVGQVLQGLSSHNLPAQHAHLVHPNIQHMGAPGNQPTARLAQQSQPVPPPADHQARCSFASKPSPEDLLERDSNQRDESRRLLNELPDFVDARIPHVEQRIKGGTGGLKSPKVYENDLNIFMSEIVKEEDLFQEKRSLINEVGRKYSVPPDIFPQNFKETQSSTVTVQKIRCLF